MPLLGQLIKSAIELGKTLEGKTTSLGETQKNQLLELLRKAQNTSFGIYYGFEQILRSEDPMAAYREAVPIFDYDQMHQRWWAQQQKQANITWPGKPQYFALSSGTTGKESKRIPVTEDMLDSFRRVGISQALNLANFDLPGELFEKEVLMLGSSANLDEKDGHLEGEISGINTSNLPPWFGGFYRPGKDIAAIDDWDKRVQEIARRAPDWDIGAIAGIPSWVQKMLKVIIEENQLEHIHEIWPNLSLYISGGVAFEPHRKSMELVLGHPITYMDTYLASEGFFAYTARPGNMDMQLALDHGMYYEFVPFDERGFDQTGGLLEKPRIMGIEEVETGQDYALLVSTPAGAWRYLIGDTVKFTNLEHHEIVISGRTKYFLNVVGSQLSEEKINAAVQKLADHFDTEIPEFAVAAMPAGQDEFKHQWILCANRPAKEQEMAKALDEILGDLNKNYRVARDKALQSVEVCVTSKEKIYDWLESRKKKGGQIKFPKVMKADTMQELLDYIEA